jgi:hypothetical protein
MDRDGEKCRERQADMKIDRDRETRRAEAEVDISMKKQTDRQIYVETDKQEDGQMRAEEYVTECRE